MIKDAYEERNGILRYIQSVEDSEMWMILSLRYINGLSGNRLL